MNSHPADRLAEQIKIALRYVSPTGFPLAPAAIEAVDQLAAIAKQQATPEAEPGIHLTAGQLRDALTFVGDDDPETEIVLMKREAFTCTEGDEMGAGLYVHLAEYPEEGAYGPLDNFAPQSPPSQVPAAQSGGELHAYLCRAWGETDLPCVTIARSREDVRQFYIREWLGDENDRDYSGELTLPGLMVDFDAHDWRDHPEITYEFEIGGVSVERVFA